MVRDGTEATTTMNANTRTPKDTDGKSSPSSPLSPTLATTDATATTSTSTSTSLTACRPEHAFHAFDALYCALTPHARPIEPLFADNK